MKAVYSALMLISVYVSACAQNNLSINNIPDSLKNKADAVIRFHTTRYTRPSIDKISEYRHYAITVFNKNGDSFNNLDVYYDQYSTVKYISATEYDASGKVISRSKKSDVKDYSAFPDYTIFSDTRVKTISPLPKQYPYTIEYEYETEEDGVLGFNTWIPQNDYKLAVQSSELIFLTPENLSFKHKDLNLPAPPTIDKEGQFARYTWKVNNLKALEDEPYSPPLSEYVSIVYLAPNEFSYHGTQGDLSTWKSYGKWQYELNTGRDELPTATINYVRSLVNGKTDTLDIIKTVYQHMQSKTRYVSIQLGIGGLQPMKASDVDKFGYGDCKALSNYTKALLKAVGVESYYTVIGNGSSRKIKFEDFASLNQGNHVILCAPLKNDTVWMECTSQVAPFGYISMSNSDRYALLITPEGGKLVRTPAYNKNVNKRECRAIVSVTETGKAIFNSNIKFQGGWYDQVLVYSLMSEKERREQILKDFSINSLLIKKLDINNIPEITPKLVLNLDMEAEKYGSLSSNRMFIELNPLNRNTFKTENLQKRKTDINISIEYTEVDTITFQLPELFSVEFLPQQYKYESVFGNYNTSILKKENSIIYIRSFSINQGKYSKDLYPEFVKFFENIAKADNCKAVLKKT